MRWTVMRGTELELDEQSFSVAGAAHDEELLDVIEEGAQSENAKPDPEEKVKFFIENVLRKSTDSSFFDNLSRSAKQVHCALGHFWEDSLHRKVQFRLVGQKRESIFKKLTT